MSRFSILASLILFVILFTQASGESPSEKAKTISLDTIWANEMPGTRDIHTLSKNVPMDELDMRLMNAVLELSYHRAERMKFKDVARPGFAVSGSGRSALHAAFAVFIDWGARREDFSSGDEITIVFFSEPVSRYLVQFQQVERKDNEIEIRYQLKPDIGGRNYTNFALIPLGKLPVGKYVVAMRQLPREINPVETKMGFKPLDEEWSRNFLCKPFSFTVTDKGK
jgi:hypothetical protein